MPDDAAFFDTILKRGAWRTEVEVRRRELDHRLKVATKDGKRDMREDVRAAHVHAVERALKDARTAVESDSSLRAWWSGSAVTLGWESVHDAAGELVEIESDPAVRHSLPRLLDWMQGVIPKGQLRDRYEKELGQLIRGRGDIDRTLVRQAHQDVVSMNSERHANLRNFRNLLTLAIVVLTLLLLMLAIWHAANPRFVSLCGSSSQPAAAQQSSPQASTQKVQQCFSGNKSAARDIFEIELIGAIAGLLSVAFGLGSEQTPPSRYNVRAAQALLKPVAGAATALVGVLLVQSGVIVSPAASASESLFLAYAAVFGFSQQLLTQFVDKRAGKLLGPAKEVDPGAGV